MVILLYVALFVFFFKQKTAYDMLISDWSSDVCSSDLFAAPILLDHDRDVEADERADVGREEAVGADDLDHRPAARERDRHLHDEIGSASCRERVCQYV